MANVNGEPTTVPARGQVTHIEVSGDVIMWAVNSPISTDQPDMVVGVVHLLNTSTNDFQTIPIKVSEIYNGNKYETTSA